MVRRGQRVRSLWLRDALDREGGERRRPALTGVAEADVCIVGGGFTGLWTALHLRERAPQLEVCLVEADLCGAGASGRNGGFVMSWWSKFATLAKLAGREEALALARAAATSVDAIGAFAEEHGIDCGWRRDGWLWTATSPAQVGAWSSAVEALREAGEEPYTLLDRAEVARRSGSPVHLAGVFEAGVATVQPAALARGLADAAEARGVRIFEGSPMTALVRRRPPVVHTPFGEVRAGRVVLATNAWSARLPELRRGLVVISSDVVATAPVPDRLAEIGWSDGLAISDSRRLVNYYRTTPEGRVVFGKGGGALALAGRIGRGFEIASPRTGELVRQLHRIYPSLYDLSAVASWRGPIDYSLDGMVFLHRLPDCAEIVVGAGYSGNGVGPAHLVGRLLASLALDDDDPLGRSALLRAPAGTLPPEPLRHLGGRVVRRAIARRERLDDAERRADPLTRAIASLDPTSFVDR